MDLARIYFLTKLLQVDIPGKSYVMQLKRRKVTPINSRSRRFRAKMRWTSNSFETSSEAALAMQERIAHARSYITERFVLPPRKTDVAKAMFLRHPRRFLVHKFTCLQGATAPIRGIENTVRLSDTQDTEDPGKYVYVGVVKIRQAKFM